MGAKRKSQQENPTTPVKDDQMGAKTRAASTRKTKTPPPKESKPAPKVSKPPPKNHTDKDMKKGVCSSPHPPIETSDTGIKHKQPIVMTEVATECGEMERTSKQCLAEPQLETRHTELQEAPVQPLQTRPTTTPGSSGISKKTRGPTRCLETWELEEDNKVFANANRYGQAVGRNATKLANFLGTVVRNGNLLPLTYTDWRLVPESSKERAWKVILNKWNLDPSCKAWCLRSIGKKWRDSKCALKKNFYDTCNNDKDRIRHRPKDIHKEDWKFLVKYWSSEKGKKRCETNKKSRSKQKLIHTTGTKSFARLREEARQNDPNGEEPTRGDFFIMTHTNKKTGEAPNRATKNKMKKLKKVMKQHDHNTSNTCTYTDDPFSKVFGKEKLGHVRTYGLGVTRKDVFGEGTGPVKTIEKLRKAEIEEIECQKRAEEERKQWKEELELLKKKCIEYESLKMRCELLESNMKKLMCESRNHVEDELSEPVAPTGDMEVSDDAYHPIVSKQPRVHFSSSRQTGFQAKRQRKQDLVNNNTGFQAKRQRKQDKVNKSIGLRQSLSCHDVRKGSTSEGGAQERPRGGMDVLLKVIMEEPFHRGEHKKAKKARQG